MKTEIKLGSAYIKHLSLQYADKMMLAPREIKSLAKQMTMFGPSELMQLQNADIDYVSLFAKKELQKRKINA
jgi:hypothetical protein